MRGTTTARQESPAAFRVAPVLSKHIATIRESEQFFKLRGFGTQRLVLLTLIREFFGPSPSALSGKQIQNHRW